MLTNKYDAIIYGNGLSLNLQTLLKQCVPKELQYRLFFSDFIQAVVDDSISIRERNDLKQVFVKKMLLIRPSETAYDAVRQEIGKAIKEFGNDFEQILGNNLIQKSERNSAVTNTIYPFFYNYWHNNLLGWINNQYKDNFFKNYCESVKGILIPNAFICTTNFDRFTDYLKPCHLHGIFSDELKTEADMFFCQKNTNGDNYYKFLWGHNGVGKRQEMLNIEQNNGYQKYFNFSFFEEKNSFSNMLIYGIGFKNAAYNKYIMPYHDSPHDGFIIDDHILRHIRTMQNNNKLQTITFAYHSEKDKKHYEELSKLFCLNRVEYLATENFKFSIQ